MCWKARLWLFWLNNFICAESISTRLEQVWVYICPPDKPYSLALLMAVSDLEKASSPFKYHSCCSSCIYFC